MADKYEYEEEEGGTTYPASEPAYGYVETECQRNTVRCCGNGCFVFLGLVTMAWVFHAIPVATVTDVPPFARSLIWMSIAHHTEPWKQECKRSFDCYQRNCQVEGWATVECCQPCGPDETWPEEEALRQAAKASCRAARGECIVRANAAFGGVTQFGDGRGNFPDSVAES